MAASFDGQQHPELASVPVRTSSRSRGWRYGAAVLLSGLAILARFYLSTLLGAGVPFILFFPTVTLCAWYGGLGPGLLSTLITAIAALFLFMEPFYSLALTNVTEDVRFGLFLAGASFISWICGNLRSAHERLAEAAVQRESALVAEHRARERAEKNEKRINRIFESITDGFIAIDDGLRCLYANPQALQIFGVNSEEVLGKDLKRALPDIKGTQFEAGIAEVMSTGSAEPIAEYFDSTKRWLAFRFYPAFDGGAIVYFQDVTESHRAAEEIRQSQELLLTTLRSIGDAVIAVDRSSSITFMNPVAESMTGWTEVESRGRHLSEVFHIINEGTREEAPNPVERVLREGIIVGLANHTLLIRKDGGEVPIDDSGAPIRDESGDALGAVLVFRDVTEKRRSEAVIAESEERFRTMADTAPVLIWASGIDWHRNFFNKPWLDFTGRTMEQESEDGWLTGVHPDDLEFSLQTYIESFDRREPFKIEYRLRRYDDEYRWVLDNGVPRFATDGRLEGYIGSCIDITDRKKPEDADRFLASASVAIAASLDYEQTLRTVAETAVGTFADYCAVDLIAEDGAIGRLAVVRKGADGSLVRNDQSISELPQFEAALVKVVETGQSELIESISSNIVLSGESDTASSEIGMRSAIAVPIKAHDRVIGAIGFASVELGRHYDSQDLMLAEQLAGRAALAIDNARLFRSVQRANRIKDEFLATLSHELRTPLTSILGWSSILRGGNQSAETIEKAVEVIERNARLQTTIIEDILDVSRIITGKLKLNVEEVNLLSVIAAAIEAIEPAANAKEIKINSVLDSELDAIFGDSSRLQQVMWNLLSNAVKFTPANGNVDVMLRRMGSNVEIKVSDTGPGIDAAFMPRLFDRFTQADSSISRKYGGLGLGLSIVRHLVELHGGHVRAENRPSGTGAVFTVELPIYAALRHGERESSGPTRQRGFLQTEQSTESRPPLAGIYILVIDDDGDARELIRTILEGAGADVTTADSVNDALSVLGVKQFNVVVSDIGMPGRDGYELVHELREGGYTLPAIALSAYAREEDRLKALACGYERHLVKPINPNELVNAVILLVETETA